ncbi:MAG: sulfite exporter TauE/SafE family protein [Fidelibacterota bacterium]|nr:MAG: sulfite exporter TauE/SafE family protein [Candidatus Neomarinimicrobiota bacterium]
MSSDIIILTWTAAGIGLIHTLTGPDHYLPFIVMGRARHWSLVRTLAITALCGVGHVLGSVVLGFIGIGAGIAVHQLVDIESVRGEIAAWGLIAFGLVYMVWGLRRGYRKRPHSHLHVHPAGDMHVHKHTHTGEHTHIHEEAQHPTRITPWVLFIIFVLGPCEPLIPLLMFPAAQSSLAGVALIAGIFGLVTITTMLGVVALVHAGIQRLPLGNLERYAHALAGGTLAFSGLAVALLGL